MALHPIFQSIVEDHMVAMSAAAPKAETYRGWAVSFEYGYYYATSPNYDASYEGPEDGWVDNGERVCGRTYDDMMAEVDNWFEENGQFGVG